MSQAFQMWDRCGPAGGLGQAENDKLRLHERNREFKKGGGFADDWR